MPDLQTDFNRLAPDSQLLPRKVLSVSTKNQPLEKGDLEKTWVAAFQQKLPAEKDLPQDMRHFLRSIKDLPDDKKIQEIHTYTLNMMHYSRDHPESVESFANLVKTKGGDCKTYAFMDATLLKYAGFKPTDVAVVGGTVHYSGDEGSSSGGHAVCIVQSDHQLKMLDPNLSAIVTLNDKLQYTDTSDNAHHGAFRMDPAVLITMADHGNAWYSDAAIKQMPTDGQLRRDPVTTPAVPKGP